MSIGLYLQHLLKSILKYSKYEKIWKYYIIPNFKILFPSPQFVDKKSADNEVRLDFKFWMKKWLIYQSSCQNSEASAKRVTKDSTENNSGDIIDGCKNNCGKLRSVTPLGQKDETERVDENFENFQTLLSETRRLGFLLTRLGIRSFNLGQWYRWWRRGLADRMFIRWSSRKSVIRFLPELNRRNDLRKETFINFDFMIRLRSGSVFLVFGLTQVFHWCTFRIRRISLWSCSQLH